MKRIFETFNIYKKDIFALALIFITFIFSISFIGRIYGNLFIDLGREAYLPQLLLDGKVLFKDIFGMYNPLSYQINAVIYLLFGSSFDVLYYISYFNALIFIVGMYFIARIFINEYFSSVISLLISSLYIFGSTNIISYIMPYSYAFPFATTFFTYSVLSFLLYMKNRDNRKHIYISMLLMGLSFACKPEFILCIIPMFVVLLLNKERIWTIASTISILVIPTILSYGILFIQGFTWTDLLHYLDFLKNFFSTEEQLYYTFNNISLNWTRPIFEYSMVVMFNFMLYVAIGALIFSLFYKNTYTKYLGLLLIPAFIKYTNTYLDSSTHVHIFCWVIFALVPVLYFKINKLSDIKDKMFLFLMLTGILSMSRVGFLPVIKYSYSIYYLIPLMAIWILFINTKISFLEKFQYKKYVSFCLILFSIVNIFFIRNSIFDYKTLDTAKGRIMAKDYFAEMFDNLTNWVNKNTKQNDTVLLMPEGIMVNYVTGRPTANKLYHLVPNHIAALGEDNIIKELTENPPEYIIINNFYYKMYNKAFMCVDFGRGICKYVRDKYTLEQKFVTFDEVNNKFISYIYKLK